MGQEKRRFSRVVFPVRARLAVAGAVYQVEQVVNLSIGGCLLALSGMEIAPGSDCTVTLLLPWMAPGVEISGRVARVGPEELSVQFTRVEPEGLFHLQNIVRYNAPDPDLIEAEIRARPGLL
jgi:hypothetical protein